nr:NADH dehydrogenase subunit 5 [Eudiplozoon nipponicum]WET59163.1 NADH dehydrogenase subunit 5 [Eudiplozoon nipponicum]
MPLIFFLLFFFCCFCFIFSFSWCIVFEVLSSFFYGCSIGLGFNFGVGEFIFLFMLFFCGFLSLNYNFYYFSGLLVNGCLLTWNLMFFLASMVFLILSSGVTSLICWEYLGIVSFFLILFYGNSVSLKASMVTLVTSRLGDLFFFLFIGYYLFFYVNWVFIGVCFIFIIGSKSAVYPMISWLLEAMRAPTPVSSLVHSSTLVAAGFWFLFEYSYLVTGNSIFFFILSGFCFTTIMLTSFVVLLIDDVKKMVALSTSNNISWCIIFFLFGDPLLGVIQLLIHGLGKCMLFILFGDLMSCNGSGQSYKGFYCIFGGHLVGYLFFSIFCLCGLPLFGVYFSKHLFFSFFVSSCYNLAFCIFCCFGVFLSFLYSFRLFFVSLGLLNGGCFAYVLNFYASLLFLPFMGFISIFLVELVDEVVDMSFYLSFILNLLSLIGVFGYFLFSGVSFISWGFSLGYLDFICYYFVFYYVRFSFFVRAAAFRLDSFFVVCAYNFILSFLSVFGSVGLFFYLV